MLKNLVIASIGMISVLSALAEDTLTGLYPPADSGAITRPTPKPRFTALDNNGAPIQLVNGVLTSPPICTQDKITGLVWEVKTRDSSLRDQNWTYTWYNSDVHTNGGDPGSLGAETCGNTVPNHQCNTQTYLTIVNATGLCGANDWRLPTMEELSSIVQAETQSPTIDATYFLNTQSSFYWTTTTDESDITQAWGVNFGHGLAKTEVKAGSNSVRLVRDGENALNSLGTAPYDTAAASNKPDLVVTTMTAGSTAQAGGDLNISATLKNRGTTTAGSSWVEIYLSSDRMIKQTDTPTSYGCNVSQISSGNTFTCSGDIVIPSSIKPGTYYVGAYADDDGVVSERVETNNGRSASNTTAVTGSSGGGDCRIRQVYDVYHNWFWCAMSCNVYETPCD